MNRGGKPGRGLEAVSSLFLSSTDHSGEVVQAPAPSRPVPRSPLLFPLFCCLHPSPALESFFACNLCLEISKNNYSVTLIDLGCERSVVRLLMGSSADDSEALACGSVSYPDYRVESLRFKDLPELTIILPAALGEQDLFDRSARRIFAREGVGKSDAILINWPIGPDLVAIPGIFTHFDKAIFLMDDQSHSPVKAYSWIKRLSPICQEFLIGAVFDEQEDSGLSLQNVSRLQRTIYKHLHIGLKLRVFAMPLNREARVSIRSKKPLALTASPTGSSSIAAIAKLCDGLLRDE